MNKKIKNTLIISSYVLLVTLLFSGAYAVGKLSVTGGGGYEVPSVNEESLPAANEAMPPAPEYEVITENGRIIIYKCIGDEKSVITSEAISETIFPKDDIAELKNGVRFEHLEGAQQLFENFVS